MSESCDGCGLDLPPGAAHVNADSCVLALRAELDRIRDCAGCGKRLKVAICPPCAAKAFAQGAAKKGATALGAALWNALNAPPGEESEGGKRFVP